MELLKPAERRKLFSKAKAASIGPITSQAIRRFGIKPAIMARRYTTEDLAEEIIARYAASQP